MLNVLKFRTLAKRQMQIEQTQIRLLLLTVCQSHCQSLVNRSNTFRHLSESHFSLGALHRRRTFAKFCHDLLHNHLSTFLCTKKCYSSHCFFFFFFFF